MKVMDAKERERIQAIAQHLWRSERPVRVLRTVAWPREARERFFERKATELPRVMYPEFDPTPTMSAIEDARRLMHPGNPIDDWFERIAFSIEEGALMLAAVGTPRFFQHSRRLYGAPSDPLADGLSTSLALARQFNTILATLLHVDVGAPAPACHLADHVAARMRTAVNEMFGDRAPAVEVVDELSSNALAGPTLIRVRRTASFTDRDIEQLIHHEAFIHVATSLNGRDQVELPILGCGHPGTTRTQEGLAVFAEFITGTIDLDRLRRLALRVLAIQMAIDGADFLQVYRFFLEETGLEGPSYESARRVFRGGVLTGGAPFTKDIVYLDGLLRVHNFLRSVVSGGRSDCLRLLFCGKLAIDDMPVLCELYEAGMCKPPTFLPPWARDLRFLLSYLSYSAFLNTVDLSQLRTTYTDLLKHAPIVSV